jgi:hypothetical protein
MMMKLLFFDYRDYESIEGFVRRLEPPRRYPGNPILESDQAVEGDHMSLYGSVVRRPEDGLWQMWYTSRNQRLGGIILAYATSEDGVHWTRPALDVVEYEGRGTNIVAVDQPHGATVFLDEREGRSGWRYKMLAGAPPSGNISAFRSADGIHWSAAAENPVIPTNPDCPMALHRAGDGRYVVYTRPEGGDRRVARAESWDFIHWSETRLVLEPGPLDPTQVQFYGMGSTTYGGYDLGTLWAYRTPVEDLGYYKTRGGRQEPELTYCRNGSSWGWPLLSGAGGYAWHRMSPGNPLLSCGPGDSWEQGSIQTASSLVFLDDEIRLYYAGSRTVHGEREWDGPEPCCGIGFASFGPDRFVSLDAGESEGRILTRPLRTDNPDFYVNAEVEEDGYVQVEIADIDAKPIHGFELDNCLPLTGDSFRHRVQWRGNPAAGPLAGPWIRLRVRARRAKIYSLFCCAEGEAEDYWKFRIPHSRGSLWEKLADFDAAEKSISA